MALFRTTIAPGTYVRTPHGWVYPVEHSIRGEYLLRGDPEYTLWSEADLIVVDRAPLYPVASVVMHEGRQYTVEGISWSRGAYQYQLTAIALAATATEGELKPVDLTDPST